MKKRKILLLVAALCFSFISHQSYACSDFLLNNAGDSVVSARTMDYDVPLKAEVVVMPRGEKCVSALSKTDTYMQWTSRYGFVGTNSMGLLAFTDGLNEEGLSIGILWLEATKYPETSEIPREKIIQIGDVARWVLGSFATIDEVKRGFETVVVGALPIKQMGNTIVPLHFLLHDRNGKSLVVEFVDGKMQMYDNPYHLLTNDPIYPEQMKGIERHKDLTNTFGGMKGLPGDSSSDSRFQLMYTLNRFVQRSNSDREAVNNAHHILNRVTTVDEEVSGKSTQYGLIRDHKNLVYYVIDNQNMNLRALDMKKLDFSPTACKMSFPIASDHWFIPANEELKPYDTTKEQALP